MGLSWVIVGQTRVIVGLSWVKVGSNRGINGVIEGLYGVIVDKTGVEVGQTSETSLIVCQNWVISSLSWVLMDQI